MRYVVLFLFFILTSNAYAKEVMIKCTKKADERIFVLFKDTGKALYASAGDIRGTFKETETEYKLHFPKTDERYEMVVTINRYSGEILKEFGQPPFGEFKKGNVFWSAKCSEMAHKKKF